MILFFTDHISSYSSQIIHDPILFRSYMIPFLTAAKNRISFVTRFQHICHSSCEICDRSRVFIYDKKSSQVKTCKIFITKSHVLQLSHVCHILLLSVSQIYFVDIHVCVYSSYKESLIMVILFFVVVFVIIAVSYNLAAVVSALAFGGITCILLLLIIILFFLFIFNYYNFIKFIKQQCHRQNLWRICFSCLPPFWPIIYVTGYNCEE